MFNVEDYGIDFTEEELDKYIASDEFLDLIKECRKRLDKMDERTEAPDYKSNLIKRLNSKGEKSNELLLGTVKTIIDENGIEIPNEWVQLFVQDEYTLCCFGKYTSNGEECPGIHIICNTANDELKAALNVVNALVLISDRKVIIPEFLLNNYLHAKVGQEVYLVGNGKHFDICVHKPDAPSDDEINNILDMI